MAEVKKESLQRRETPEKQKEKMKAVVSSDGIVRTKKTLGERLTEQFLDKSSKNIKKYLWNEVIVPGFKDTVLDTLSMIFFGETIINKNRSRSGGSRYESRSSYSRYYDDRSSRRSSYTRNNRYEEDSSCDYRNIVLYNRTDAEEVVYRLREKIRDFGDASIADLFNLVGMDNVYTDNNYGWTDERDIGIKEVHGGWLIDVADARSFR